jgi:hypothetical protein
MGKVYKTMQGREVDMDKLMSQHELMPAVGNVRVNARGDELGQGGKIVKKREDVIAEYYENNPKATPDIQTSAKPKQQSGIVETKKSKVIGE